jgi:spore coat polysaccharide biosynthesis predicted glycosyltransferase SpsG
LSKLCPDVDRYHIKVLVSRYDDMEAELPQFGSLLSSMKPRAILVDSYFATPHYLSELRSHARTFYIDDVGKERHPVDVVIGYGLYSHHENEGTKYLIGPAYAPLREQFRDLSYAVQDTVRDVLITTGGSDDMNITGKILDAVLAGVPDNVHCHVVVGAVNRYRDDLRKRSDLDRRIIIHENIVDMASLMQGCDIAIAAAGSTIYELCAVGVPTICFTMAGNQIPNAEGLSSLGAVIYAGDYRSAELVASIENHITTLTADSQRRITLSTRMRNLVDGYGARRIVDEIDA